MSTGGDGGVGEPRGERPPVSPIPSFVRVTTGWLFAPPSLLDISARWRIITAFIGLQVALSLGCLVPLYAVAMPSAFPLYVVGPALAVAGVALARARRDVAAQLFVTGGLYASLMTLILGTGGASSPALVTLVSVPTIPVAVRHDRSAVVWVLLIVATRGVLAAPWVDAALPPAEIAPWFAPWAGVWFFLVAVTVVAGGMAMASEASVNLADELVRTVADLQERSAAAREATEAKSAFLASMSHEIRTPMNGVLGTARLLSLTDLDATQRACLATMEVSATALLGMLDDVLEVSRIDAGVLPVREDDVELDRMLDVVVASGRAGVGDRPIHVRAELGDAPPWVRTDPSRLRQVLMNLMSNAVKYTDAGEVVMRASRGPARDDGAIALQIEVRDTGVGIGPKDHERIFERFVRGDAHMSGNIPGTGLGLSIVRTVVTALGGTVTLASEPGSGSTFTVTLPVTEAAAPSPRRKEPGAVLGGLKVLLVEDNAVNREVAGAILRRGGCEVDIAGDGVAAVEGALARRYDVVLMDCSLPLLSGVDAAGRLREGGGASPEDIPIVAVTADNLDTTRATCAAVGMDAFLLKPFTPAALELVVGVMCGRIPPPERASFLLRPLQPASARRPGGA